MLKVDLEMQNFARGFLRESRVFPDNRGLLVAMDKKNLVTFSKRGVLRGMHFQKKPHQSKTLMVIAGEILDVIVDCRPKAKTFGAALSFGLVGALTLDPKKTGGRFTRLEIPAGFAHGYLCLTDAIVQYVLGSDYVEEEQDAFAWNSAPTIKLFEPHLQALGLSEPTLSARDAATEQLMVFDPSRFPFYGELG